MYKFLCEHMVSFLLGIELGVELLGHMVAIYLTFLGTAKLSSVVALQYWILKWTFLCFKIQVIS